VNRAAAYDGVDASQNGLEVVVVDDITRLATEYQDFRQRTAPIWAHLQGDYRFADRAEDVSRAGEDAEIAESRAFAARAEAIPENALAGQDRLTRELVAWDAGVRADLAEARLAEITISPIGPQASLPVMLPKLGLPTSDVADAMPAKLRGIARLFRDLGERHREGKAQGRLPARVLIEQTITQLDGWLTRPVDEDPLLVAPSPAVADPVRWTAGLRSVIERDVRPALAGYRDILRDELLAAARSEDRVGLRWIPGGDDSYARAIRFHTTLSRSPLEIHEVGLAQVARLTHEYREIGSQVLGTMDLERIFEGLRSDQALHHTNGPDIIEASEVAVAKARVAMRGWFGRVPKADCHVEEVQTGSLAYYYPPSKDSTRDGVVFFNTAEPAGWGRFVIEATSYHEGIPGHHLQVAIAAELKGIPDFRRQMFLPAYGEGWGLYAERLADEMGLYATPLDRLGMLSMDSLRACRLVIDTGLHALGWSRRQAIEFMVRNSPIPDGPVTAEIDRSIGYPGEVLAYMLGRLEIERLRADARARLGDRFDIKAFHDTVLGSGSLPLPLLDLVIGSWVEETAHA
jgi:uncharacterized protein (DUF885 family)